VEGRGGNAADAGDTAETVTGGGASAAADEATLGIDPSNTDTDGCGTDDLTSLCSTTDPLDPSDD
jgi:hypothetical protein